MLDPEQLSKIKIIGERNHDDLPCSECDKIGPILIVSCRANGRTYDVCHGCVLRLGLKP